MIKSAQADKIRKWREERHNSSTNVITMLEDLQTDAASLVELVEQIVELSKEPSKNQESLAKKQEKRIKLWDTY
ncbi:hypothetical protein IWQ61_010572, partial [Dispira simplex]